MPPRIPWHHKLFIQRPGFYLGIMGYCITGGVVAYTPFYEIPRLESEPIQSALPKFAERWDRWENTESWSPSIYFLAFGPWAHLDLDRLARKTERNPDKFMGGAIGMKSLSYVLATMCPVLAVYAMDTTERPKIETRMLQLALKRDDIDIVPFLRSDEAKEMLKSAMEEVTAREKENTKAGSEDHGNSTRELNIAAEEPSSDPTQKSETDSAGSWSKFDSETQFGRSFEEEELERKVSAEQEAEWKDLLAFYREASKGKLTLLVFGGIAGLASAFF